MLANNETGVVQAIPQIARTVQDAGGLLHVDAVQALGRMPFDISELGCDLLTVSAHKIGGPKGVGAFIRRDEALQMSALIRGGGQERSLRAGTENVAGIAAFGAAAEAVRLGMAADIEHMRALQERLETGIASGTPDAVIFGTAADRLPNTTLVALPGVKAETAVIAFDLEGVAVSSGAACSSGKVAPSHVLEAMQVAPELTRGAIRISLGPATTEEEIQAFLKTWGKLAGTLYKNRPIAA
jgi:cysteine desulfurase